MPGEVVRKIQFQATGCAAILPDGKVCAETDTKAFEVLIGGEWIDCPLCPQHEAEYIVEPSEGVRLKER